MEFSALPTSEHLIPGQTNNDEEEEEEDEDAKSLANDSFTTAASTLSLGDICKVPQGIYRVTEEGNQQKLSIF